MTVDMETPTLPAYATLGGSWRVWCRYCSRWHQHGAQPGHRAAHCRVEHSPYRRTGYILRLDEGER